MPPILSSGRNCTLVKMALKTETSVRHYSELYQIPQKTIERIKYEGVDLSDPAAVRHRILNSTGRNPRSWQNGCPWDIENVQRAAATNTEPVEIVGGDIETEMESFRVAIRKADTQMGANLLKTKLEGLQLLNKNLILEGSYMLTEDVNDAMQKILSVFRTEISAMPTLLGGMLEGLKAPAIVSKTEALFHQLMETTAKRLDELAEIETLSDETTE